MAHLTLQPHVGYGFVGEHLVFLDLRRDRYLTLDPAAETAFRRIAPQAGTSQAEATRAARGEAGRLLLATGLFRHDGRGGDLAPAAVARPAASLLDDTAAPRAGWTERLRVWRAVARARKRLRTEPLLAVVEAVRAQHAAAADHAAVEAAARTFLAARPLVPIERSCLLDALALLDWLGDRAGGARLVFGVRLDPFRAHCWVQTDRLLLTDAGDEIGALVPVLAV